MSNNHPSRNAAQSKLRTQYETLEQIAGILNGCNQHEFAHAVRCAIFDLKALRSEVLKLKNKISIAKSTLNAIPRYEDHEIPGVISDAIDKLES